MKERPYPITITEGGKEQQHFLVRNEDKRKELRRKKDAQNIGLVAVQRFWNKRYCDYVGFTRIDDQGNEGWIRIFGQEEFVLWLGGVALDERETRLLHTANREKGSFSKQWGWKPDILIDWMPTTQEEEAFIDWELKKDEEPNGTLYIPKEG